MLNSKKFSKIISLLSDTPGDDYVLVKTGALAAGDLIDLGSGTDTLHLTGDLANNLVLRGVENLTLSDGAGGSAQNVSSTDKALNISVQVKTADDDINFTGSNLLDGTKLTATAAADGTKQTAGDTTLNFKAGEKATTTVDYENGSTGALTVTNVADLTVNYGAASNTAAAIGLDKNATALTLNATKGALIITDIANVASESLATLKVTAADAFTANDILNSDKLETVSITAEKALTVKDTTAAGKLSTFTAKSNDGAVDIGLIANTAPALENTISSISISGATTAITDAIGEGTKTNINDISITGSNGLVTVGAIAAKGLGSVAVTSTKNVAKLADAAVTAADTDGYTVNITADTAIYGTTNTTTAAEFKNTKGDITTATLAVTGTSTTAVASYVDFDLSGADNVGSLGTLNATGVKGGLTTIITNDEIKDVGTTTVSFGAKDSTTANSVTLSGYVGKVTVNGSTGKDTVVDDARGVDAAVTNVTNSSDTFVGGDGVDTISYATHIHTTGDGNNGMAINLSSSSVTFGSGSANETTLAATTAAEYDATYYAGSSTAANKAIVANGETDSITSFEVVIGTAKDDYIKVGAIGATVAGGAGADKIVLGDSSDTVVYTAVAESQVADGDLTSLDQIADFNAGDDGSGPAPVDKIDISGIAGLNDSATVLAGATAQLDEVSVLTDLDGAFTGGAASGNDNFQLITGDGNGDLGARAFLVADINDDGNITAADIVIELTGMTGTLSADDFITA